MAPDRKRRVVRPPIAPIEQQHPPPLRGEPSQQAVALGKIEHIRRIDQRRHEQHRPPRAPIIQQPRAADTRDLWRLLGARRAWRGLIAPQPGKHFAHERPVLAAPFHKHIEKQMQRAGIMLRRTLLRAKLMLRRRKA